jgi:hypothetical protein
MIRLTPDSLEKPVEGVRDLIDIETRHSGGVIDHVEVYRVEGPNRQLLSSSHGTWKDVRVLRGKIVQWEETSGQIRWEDFDGGGRGSGPYRT